jgi:hypothetical protein
MRCTVRLRAQVVVGCLSLVAVGIPRAEGGDWFARRRAGPPPVAVPVMVPTVQRFSAVPPGPLGTFFPSPYSMVRGNGPTGGGFAPLGVYGDQTMVIYGPLSPWRSTAAPVLTYTRGYDGSVVPTMGTAFSNPNLPPFSPVVYPTQRTNYFGPRELRSPPWWADAGTWIDQN